MITGQLPWKYHKKFEHFLYQRKTSNCQTFVNIEDKYFKTECSAIANTFVSKIHQWLLSIA